MSDIGIMASLKEVRGSGSKSFSQQPTTSSFASGAAAAASAAQPSAGFGGWFDHGALIAVVAAGVAGSTAYMLLQQALDKRKRPTPRPVTPPKRSSQMTTSPSSPIQSPTVQTIQSAGFLKLEELGRGAFGVVYKGRHNHTGELVAIKEMAVADSEELRSEFTLAVGLTHENVVRVIHYEVGRHHARLYLEWVAGGSLADAMKVFPVEERLARSYIRQILAGLGFLHEHNILHRDIKPKNILVDHRGILKLTDFGLSRHLDSIHDRTRAAGTPVYMAPECVRGQFTIGSDIWAVGATLSEMLLRELPWSHIDPLIQRNPMALLYHIGQFQGHRGHHPTIPKNVSAECQNFLEICFAAEPKDRQTCRALLQHPWFSATPTTDNAPRRVISEPNSPNTQRESTETFSQVSQISRE
ncbi:protein kinase, putative [Bodo saltans]|uniref:Protein kinase, putative n=1 Tax=Bodo saltans TaxID=75058 RepID=A0A0S4JA09_BODSA|nr:protein kinase, putative [Bodo saltans]|eukprot:CUG88383.1 protein kinase, putative [Bodo saltans]